MLNVATKYFIPEFTPITRCPYNGEKTLLEKLTVMEMKEKVEIEEVDYDKNENVF
jgi:hypothetical protein